MAQRWRSTRWLQFSLRSLLLTMIAVSLAFTIYRSPWTETTEEILATRTITYRRDWRGKRQKHGRESLTQALPGQRSYEAFYEDGVMLREKVTHPNINVHLETIYDPQTNQKVERDLRWLEKTGLVLETSTWKGSDRFLKAWKDKNGKVLESLTGDAINQSSNRLTHWRERPIAEEMQRVLALLSEEDRIRWLTPGPLTNVRWKHGEESTSLFRGESGTEKVEVSLSGVDPGLKDKMCRELWSPAAGPLAYRLLEVAFQHGATIECRDGLLTVRRAAAD